MGTQIQPTVKSILSDKVEVMEDIKLKNIDINEFKKAVYSYYLDIFPEDERKPLELIQLSYKKRIYKNYKSTI